MIMSPMLKPVHHSAPKGKEKGGGEEHNFDGENKDTTFFDLHSKILIVKGCFSTIFCQRFHIISVF